MVKAYSELTIDILEVLVAALVFPISVFLMDESVHIRLICVLRVEFATM